MEADVGGKVWPGLGISAVLLAAAIGVVLFSGTGQVAPDDGPALVSPSATATATAAADATEVDALPAAGAERSAVVSIAESPQELAESSALEIEGRVEMEASMEEKDLVKVAVLVHGDRWLSDREAGFEGNLLWGATPATRAMQTIKMTSATEGVVEVHGRPSTHEEFADIHLAGFVFRPTSLDETPGGAAELLLNLEPVPGATLVWAESMPLGQRVPIEIVMSARDEPTVPKEEWWGDASVRVERNSDCQLPFLLPRLVRKESVWIGAPGRAWRAFPVGPDDLEVEVQLVDEASLRVLHDGPGALDPSTGRPVVPLHVILESLHSGTLQVKPVVDRAPILFAGLSRGEYRVRVARGTTHDAEEVSGTTQFKIEAGESVEVNLTRGFADQHLGSIRLHVSGSDEVMALGAEAGLEVTVLRRAEPGARWPWIRERTMRPGEGAPDGVRLFEKKGLVPGEYLVTVSPLGSHAPCEVHAGKVTNVDLRLEEPGWLTLRLPEGYDADMCIVSITTAAMNPKDRYYFPYNRMVAEALDGRHPIIPGTYRMDVYSLGAGDLPPLAAYDFVVRSGQECLVAPEPLPNLRFEVEVHEARAGQEGKPIALPFDFWANVKMISQATGEQLFGVTSFTGDASTCIGISVSLAVEPETIRLELPENPFWTFAPPEPFDLVDGMTVVLQATAK
ncbi:hypothetical protein Poly30_54220 [Planctomycetes bacterium Poly30]|uniref:Uncharacterized protein n=1 Tax=Saltatorellus ferox TaxID=2528018 RepID=A0A518F0J6_9BACT|nr:hypothetical protein Poly30_54220 [Planctomycetes bacterium Poly30]